LFDARHLDAGRATTLFDLGCGFGKLALQAFFEFPNLTSVVGVELCKSHYAHACKRLSKWAATDGRFSWHVVSPTVHELRDLRDATRALQLRQENLYSTPDVGKADIVICETAMPVRQRLALGRLSASLKPGARLMHYHSLEDLPGALAVAQEGPLVIALRECALKLGQTAKVDGNLGTKSLQEGLGEGTVVEFASTTPKVIATFRCITRSERYPTSWDATGYCFSLWTRL
jgi:SAM-dependent methyltransferase